MYIVQSSYLETLLKNIIYTIKGKTLGECKLKMSFNMRRTLIDIIDIIFFDNLPFQDITC